MDRAAAKPDVIHLKFLGEPAPQGSKQITRWAAWCEVSAKIHPVRRFNTLPQSNKGEPITEAAADDICTSASEEPLRNGSKCEEAEGLSTKKSHQDPDLDKLKGFA